jgi:hypothetical protein
MRGNSIGKRTLERLHQRWFDTVKRDLSKTNNTFSINMARDRDRWKRIVEAAKDLNNLRSVLINQKNRKKIIIIMNIINYSFKNL